MTTEKDYLIYNIVKQNLYVRYKIYMSVFISQKYQVASI